MLNASELSKIIFRNAEEWHVAATGMLVEDEALHIFWRSLAEYCQDNEKPEISDLKEICSIGARIFDAFDKPKMPDVEMVEALLYEETIEDWVKK